MNPVYPKWAVVVETAPRSKKISYWIVKLDDDFDYPFYRTWARADYVMEAWTRVRELNAVDAEECWKNVEKGAPRV